MGHNFHFVLTIKQKLQQLTSYFKYQELRYNFVKYNEGSSPRAYRDIANNVTVGIGFNMDTAHARAAWDQALKGSVSFDLVYRQEASLSEEAIKLLFHATINVRERELQRIYKLVWSKLKLHERLAIEDAYFNAPGLVKGGSNPTKFYILIHEYIKHINPACLYLATKELLCRSNPKKSAGIHQRRYRQALMLCIPGQELALANSLAAS